jgi:hypothetical protein
MISFLLARRIQRIAASIRTLLSPDKLTRDVSSEDIRCAGLNQAENIPARPPGIGTREMPLKVCVLKLVRSHFTAMAASIKPELKIDLDVNPRPRAAD